MNQEILKTFEEYQKVRETFAQTVAEYTTNPQNFETLESLGIIHMLKSLLLDYASSVQQSAALALGRLASYSENFAELVVAHEILPPLVQSLTEIDGLLQKNAAFALRAVAQHSPELAQTVVNNGGLEYLAICLERSDSGVKETAAWAFREIAGHNSQLAKCVVGAGAVKLLVLCVQKPEISLKKIAISALNAIVRHSTELAQKVVDANAVQHLSQYIDHSDSELKSCACYCLAQIAKHTVELAESVVKAEIFPRILNCLKDIDIDARKSAATCIREIAKQSDDFAKLLVNVGVLPAIVDYINEVKGSPRSPGIMTLGYLSAFNENLAMGVIVSKGVPPLKDALKNEEDDYIKAAAAWTFGQIGRHSADHARALAEQDILNCLLEAYLDEHSSEDLKFKSKRALKMNILMCTHLPALESLLQQAPPKILKYLIIQFAKILPHDIEARNRFLQSGGLQKIQEIDAAPGSKLREYKETINSLYPPDAVSHHSHTEILQKKAEHHK